MSTIESMERLINSFTQIQSVGKKTAERYAYSILNMPLEEVEEFARNLVEAKQNIKFCSVCGNWSETEVCNLCSNRQPDIICVVKEPKDVLAIEKVRDYNGTYHVLHGTISPLNGKGPNDINLKSLITRVQNNNVKEVILALNADVEGEATSLYIAKLLKPLEIKVTKLAQGIAMGSDIEYQDEVTLAKALEDRKPM